jgi:hypothetical protein
MPVSMVQVECPCCGRSVELILVGSAHDEDEVLPPRRQRRSRARPVAGEQLELADGGGRAQER